MILMQGVRGWGFGILVGLMLFTGVTQAAVKIDAAAEYPVMVGLSAQNFNSNPGFSASVSADGLITPWMRNYFSVSYASFSLRADSASSFRLVPITTGVGFQGKVTDELFTETDLGLGGAFGFFWATGNALPFPECQPFKGSFQLRALGLLQKMQRMLPGQQ